MMHRRSFLVTAAGTAAGGIAIAAGRADAFPLPAGPREGEVLVTPPMVWAPRADGAEFVWAVSRLSRGRVELRPAGGAATSVAKDRYGFVPQSSGVMRVQVDGLQPGGDYEWRAVVEAIDGEPAREETAWRRFRTLDPAAAATTFCVWNDTHENHETIRRLQEATPPADFLLWNGDTCNDWHEEGWLVPTLMAPAGVDISDGHPLLLTLGNHDVRGKYAFRLPDHVGLPDDRPYYAFRSGPVAVIALNTGEDKPDDHPSFQGRVAFQQLRQEQAAWLARTIARPEFAAAPYRVVFCHLPLRWIEEVEEVDYAGGGFDRYARSSRDLWHEALVAWGAQVVISGHTHRPASIPANAAFPYAQMIGGGPRPEQATWMEARAGAEGLTITVRSLAGGGVLHEEHFGRLA
jgi:hypothetical protein